MKIAIAGGSAAGLFAALLLARARHDEVYIDPQVVGCTREALGRYGSGPPVAQPTREQLLAALAR